MSSQLIIIKETTAQRKPPRHPGDNEIKRTELYFVEVVYTFNNISRND